jgi:hypothetical protein
MTDRPAPKTMREGGIRVLVCGGRDFSDWPQLALTLDQLRAERGIELVIHGAAPGADTLADTWARSRDIAVDRYYALWKTEGRAAGPRRNQRMLDAGPDLVVSFSGGKGTADMVRRARAAGIEVIEVAPKTMRRPADRCG